MTVSNERAPTINNWADEIDELNLSVIEEHLRAVFWRRVRTHRAAGEPPQVGKISSGTPPGEEV